MLMFNVCVLYIIYAHILDDGWLQYVYSVVWGCGVDGAERRDHGTV